MLLFHHDTLAIFLSFPVHSARSSSRLARRVDIDIFEHQTILRAFSWLKVSGGDFEEAVRFGGRGSRSVVVVRRGSQRISRRAYASGLIRMACAGSDEAAVRDNAVRVLAGSRRREEAASLIRPVEPCTAATAIRAASPTIMLLVEAWKDLAYSGLQQPSAVHDHCILARSEESEDQYASTNADPAIEQDSTAVVEVNDRVPSLWVVNARPGEWLVRNSHVLGQDVEREWDEADDAKEGDEKEA